MKIRLCNIFQKALRIFIYTQFFLLIITNISSAENMTIAIAPMPIYSEMKDFNNGKGLVYDLIMESAKSVGITPKFYFYPLKRTVHMFVKDEVDFLVGSPDFVIPYGIDENEIGFVPVMKSNLHLFYYKHNISKEVKFGRLSDLNHYLICILRGVPLKRELIKEGIKTYEVNDHDSGFHMLKKKRVDFFVTTPLIGKKIIFKLFPEDAENFSIIEKPVESKIFGIIMKKSNERAGHINMLFKEGLEKIKKSKKYELVFKKYWNNTEPVNTMLK